MTMDRRTLLKLVAAVSVTGSTGGATTMLMPPVSVKPNVSVTAASSPTSGMTWGVGVGVRVGRGVGVNVAVGTGVSVGVFVGVEVLVGVAVGPDDRQLRPSA